MKRFFLLVSLFGGISMSAQHSNVQSIFTQLENLPSYYSEFLKEYTYDVNQNLNQSFFYNLQTSAEVMDTGEFTIGLLMGGGMAFPPHDVDNQTSPLFTNENLSLVNGEVPTLFNYQDETAIRFAFIDPSSGQEVVNPNDGSRVAFELAVPGGLGLGYIYVPSASISLGYGVGHGTEVRAYVLPKFGLAAGAAGTDFAISRDFAYGASVKHEITTWIPKLLNRGWHISADVAYSAMSASVEGAFLQDLESDLSAEFNDNYIVEVASALEGVDYDLSTYGTRLFVGKTFSWIELSAFAGWMNNTYSMASIGSVNATLIDKSGNNPDTELVLEDFANFNGSNSNSFYGASFVLGKGWFRLNAAYTYTSTGGQFVSTGFNFYF
ncbi:MAG: hypothetical protein HWD92_11545 [Flavobacteriia bacterium]|nr:hypothetical protein [Flavobacteriia bacterium]